jgi:tRNA uridine 5-carbamoylmethylation protein Kti12
VQFSLGRETARGFEQWLTIYQQELGLLCDAASIVEQMKVLSRSRGASTEVLADAHVSEVEDLKREHIEEMERLKRHHADEVVQLAREYTVRTSTAGCRSVTDDAIDGS